MPHERIEMNPHIMAGKPVIRGTRIPVELILRKLGVGMSPEAVLADHPRLTHDDVKAVQDMMVGAKEAGVLARRWKRYPSAAACEDDGFCEGLNPILRASPLLRLFVGNQAAPDILHSLEEQVRLARQ